MFSSSFKVKIDFRLKQLRKQLAALEAFQQVKCYFWTENGT